MSNKNQISIALFNYEAGGQSTEVDGDTFTIRYDLSGFRRSIAPLADDAPDVLVVNEAKGWEAYGGTVLGLATEIASDTLGRSYASLHGVGVRGPGSAPAVLYDPQTVSRDYWGDKHETVHPDKKNILNMHIRAHKAAKFGLIIRHLNPFSGDARLEEAREIHGHAKGGPRMILGDLNCPASGPHMPQIDWDAAPEHLRFNKGIMDQNGNVTTDTRAVDFLIGKWQAGQYESWLERIPGWPKELGSRRMPRKFGWYLLSEIAHAQGTPAEEAFRPTTNESGSGTQIDHMIVNETWREGLVPDTFTIHVPAEHPDGPPSDHRVVSASLWVPS